METDIKVPLRYLLEGQLQHIMLLSLLVPGAVYLARPAFDGSSWLGISDSGWFHAVLLVAIIHQVVVWFVWRTQLISSLFSRLFGRYDMLVWGVIFLPLLLMRPILMVALGLADFGSLGQLRGLQVAVGLLLLIPAAYTGWSFEMHFGAARALGGDHFRQSYREMPFVRKAAFKYSSNAMYTFGFLLLWSIALFTGSRAALAAALFQHAYIWVHLYCTEEPDMRVIYGIPDQPGSG
ncbi:methyltransferase [Chloroflexota bacterium]